MATASVNGTTITYDDHGAGDTLLLIHGGMLSRAEWQPQIEAFARHFRVIAADVRGHGESGREGRPYSIRQWAADMASLLDALGLDRAFVCGHSMGGMVAQELAAEAPHHVRALVIAESNYGTKHDLSMRLAAGISTTIFKLLGPRIAVRAATAALAGPPHFKALVAHEIDAHAADGPNLFAILDAMNGYDGIPNLTRIKCPTLVIHGANFKMGHRQHAHMAATIPHARLVTIARAGHGLNWDNPADSNAAVLDFLKEQRQKT